jgi:Outer membrane protein beta-barrel domain
MVRSIFVLSILASSLGFAEGIVLKPKLIQSQMTLDADDAEGGDQYTIPGKGAGLDLEFAVGDSVRLGTGVSYTEFDRFDQKAFDTALGGYAAFDLVKSDSFSLYGKGGVSWHQFGVEGFETASLVNGDVGVGASLALSPSLDLGAEYLYSTTLVKDELKLKDYDDFRLKGLTQTRNDYSVFVAMKI